MTPDLARYDELLLLAKRTARFGIEYRRKYAAQNDTDRRRFAISETSPVLEFVVMAILSGVLGNAGWATITSVAGRIRDSAQALKNPPPGTADVAIGAEALDALRTHAAEYILAPAEIPEAIQHKIREEEMVDRVASAAMEVLERALSDPSSLTQLTEEQFLKRIQGDIKAAAKAKRETTETNWDDLWRNAGA